MYLKNFEFKMNIEIEIQNLMTILCLVCNFYLGHVTNMMLPLI